MVTEEQKIKLPTIIGKAREFQKNIYFCFTDYAKAFVWITTNWKILFFLDDTKEFIVNVVANTLRIAIIKKKLENYTFKVCAFFHHLYIRTSTNILSTEILNGMVHFHIISWLSSKQLIMNCSFNYYSVFINSVMIWRILSSGWKKKKPMNKFSTD